MANENLRVTLLTVTIDFNLDLVKAKKSLGWLLWIWGIVGIVEIVGIVGIILTLNTTSKYCQGAQKSLI